MVSFIADRDKTRAALHRAARKLFAILPAFLIMLILTSIALFIFPDTMLLDLFGGDDRLRGVFFAAVIGSLTLVPGFIAFPICGILLSKGVPYMVLSAFTTTLMMVGVLTFPVEKEYFGVRVTIIRNIISFCIALLVAAVTGVFFGEVF